MENWGLVTFRESSLLMENETTSSAAKQRVVLIIAHELAHQWFGNLVTMKWWDDLWLNEGFASYAEYIGTNKIFPEWAMIDQFIHSRTMPALKTDALSTSHTLSVTVVDPADIEAIFDAISYNKVSYWIDDIEGEFLQKFTLVQGAAILYMLQRVLGEDMMRQGLQLYLKEHQYANANTDDLWQALSLGSLNSSHHVETKVIMDSWTHQLGYPLVTLHHHGNLIHASQKHFVLVNSTMSHGAGISGGSNSSQKWYIPLSYTTSANPQIENQIWMHGKDGISFTSPI